MKCARHRPSHTRIQFHVSLSVFLSYSLSLSLSPLLAPRQRWLIAFESQQQIWFLPWVLWAGCHAHKAKQLAPVCQNSFAGTRNSHIRMYFATTAKATTTITTETTSRKAFHLQFARVSFFGRNFYCPAKSEEIRMKLDLLHRIDFICFDLFPKIRKLDTKPRTR